jgi:hypothetical protein
MNIDLKPIVKLRGELDELTGDRRYCKRSGQFTEKCERILGPLKAKLQMAVKDLPVLTGEPTMETTASAEDKSALSSLKDLEEATAGPSAEADLSQHEEKDQEE